MSPAPRPPLALVVVVVLVFALGGASACGGAAPPAPAPAAAAGRVLVNVDDDGVAMMGLDPVSYTAPGGPEAGDAAHAVAHGGATYWFASADHAAAFAAAPDQHAPRYGGFCAYAASQGRLTEVDPEIFLIHDGHLLLFASHDFHDRFAADPARLLAEADRRWPALVARHGAPVD